MKLLEDIRFLFISIFIMIAGTVLYFIFSPAPEVTLKKDIRINPEKYQRIVRAVAEHENQLPLNKLIAKKRIPASLIIELEKADIDRDLNYISIKKANQCIELSFTLFYAKYEVNYTPCPDIEELQQNKYYKNGFIEVWKINDNWSIILDSDFI